MKKNKRKRRIKKNKMKFKMRYVLVIIALIYVSSIFIKQEIQIRRLDKSIAKETQKKAELEEYIKKNSKQAEILSKISSSDDPIAYINSLNTQGKKEEYEKVLNHIENIAREELFMLKPNEIIYIDKDRAKNAFEKEN